MHLEPRDRKPSRKLAENALISQKLSTPRTAPEQPSKFKTPQELKSVALVKHIPMTPPTRGPARLMDLPDEVRQLVYNLALSDPTENTSAVPDPLSPQLLIVSAHIWRQALSEYYANNDLIVRRGDVPKFLDILAFTNSFSSIHSIELTDFFLSDATTSELETALELLFEMCSELREITVNIKIDDCLNSEDNEGRFIGWHVTQPATLVKLYHLEWAVDSPKLQRLNYHLCGQYMGWKRQFMDECFDKLAEWFRKKSRGRIDLWDQGFIVQRPAPVDSL